ncbi:MAG TPA: glycosyltransferase family 4 protein [Verrucomicrobiae bacterium]
MRVTHVITRLIVGGAQENTVASVLGLRRMPGLQVDLISGPATGPEGSLGHLCAAEPGLLTTLPQLVRRINPWTDWLALRALTRTFLGTHPDIVHTHSGKAGLLGRLAAARASVPVVIHTIHGPSFGAFQGPLANALFTTAERRAARVTTHFVVVCDAMKEQYLAAGIGEPAQYTKILSGFELGPFLSATNDLRLRDRLGIRPDDLVIGKIARLFKLKGHDDLFAVATNLVRACPRIKFLLVGDGPWRGRFEAKACALGLQDRFVFAGLVPPEKVASFVGVMDVLVHLSAREGLARALPQAMAAGRPVVAYDADGAGEVCRDGETGFLVRRGDLETVQKRLLQLAEDPELRNRLGRAGREFVRGRFGVDRMVEDLYSLYTRLEAQRLRGSPPLSTHRIAC